MIRWGKLVSLSAFGLFIVASLSVVFIANESVTATYEAVAGEIITAMTALFGAIFGGNCVKAWKEREKIKNGSTDSGKGFSEGRHS